MILTRVAWLLVAIWLLCALLVVPLHRAGIAGNYIIAGALSIAAVGMGGYLVAKGKDLTKNERWGIVLSVPIWMILAFSFL
jgi:hypothetical protein